VAGAAAVKAERSEFILSLDGGRASHNVAFRAKENMDILLARPVSRFTTAEPKLSSPFHPHSV
jgi:hypothetical protein